ncbi:MAG: hypothetical protein FWD46_07110 [Cystobacterineae bacterium]|nr:hypothetical protein [Cystobacterineae bacterium]
MSLQPTQEEQHILEAVHSKILLDNYASAFRDIQKVLEKLEKSVPSSESWQLIAKALALKGFALNKQKKTRASEEAFAAILKVDSNYQLDNFIFPPTVVQSFEQLRQALGKQQKASLRLSAAVEGAQVFANGAPLGQVPLERELLPGSYRVVLERGGKVSTPIAVQLSLEAPTLLEIPFQWELVWQQPLCLQAEGELAVLAFKQMGKELGAERLVKLDILPSPEKRGLRAAFWDLNTDKLLREGGILLESGRREASLERLAEFVISGKLERGENRVLPVSPEGELIESSDEPRLPFSQRQPEKGVLSPVPSSSSGKLIRGNTARAVSWVFMGAGSGLILGAGVAEICALVAASNANKILQEYNGGPISDFGDASRHKAFLGRKQDSQTIAIIMGATGLASLTTGLILYFALPPKMGEPSASVAPYFGTDGGGMTLVGRF